MRPVWYINNNLSDFRQKNVKKCENRKFVVSSFGLRIHKITVRGSHFAMPAFQDLKPLASFSARKSSSKSLITSLGFTSTTETIHPTYFTTHRQTQHSQKMRLDYLWTGCYSRQNKTRSALYFFMEKKKRSVSSLV